MQVNLFATTLMGYDDSADIFNINTGTSFGSNFVIDNSGNVGIGTTGPTAALQIGTASGNVWLSGGGSFILESGGKVGYSATSANTGMYVDSTPQLKLQVAGSDKVTVLTSGNVGIGTTTPNTKLAIDAGNLSLGNASAGTNADNVLVFANGTAPTTSPADAVQLYAEDVAASSELRVRDEAGNVTTLSPHHFSLFSPADSDYGGIQIPWSFYSKNEFKGQELNVDMLGAIQAVEVLSGRQFVYAQDLATGEAIATGPAAAAENEENSQANRLPDSSQDPQNSNIREIVRAELGRWLSPSSEGEPEGVASTALASLTARVADLEQALAAIPQPDELTGSLDVLELKELVIKEKLVVHGGLNILGDLTVAGNANVAGNLTRGNEQAGQVTIPHGKKWARITFTKPFQAVPHIQSTPFNTTISHSIDDVTPDGFIITLREKPDSDVTISWLAIAADSSVTAEFGGQFDEPDDAGLASPEPSAKAGLASPELTAEAGASSPAPAAAPAEPGEGNQPPDN